MLEPRRFVEGLGEHQPVVRLGRRGVLRGEAHGDAVQPLLSLLAHWTSELAENYVARRVAAEEVDAALLVGRVALPAFLSRGEDDVAMRIVHGDHAFSAGDADLQ